MNCAPRARSANQWTYLRFVRDKLMTERKAVAPAAGTFEGWPKAAKEITVLDPCMGTGHFLVFALPILSPCGWRKKNCRRRRRLKRCYGTISSDWRLTRAAPRSRRSTSRSPRGDGRLPPLPQPESRVLGLSPRRQQGGVAEACGAGCCRRPIRPAKTDLWGRGGESVFRRE